MTKFCWYQRLQHLHCHLYLTAEIHAPRYSWHQQLPLNNCCYSVVNTHTVFGDGSGAQQSWLYNLPHPYVLDIRITLFPMKTATYWNRLPRSCSLSPWWVWLDWRKHRVTWSDFRAVPASDRFLDLRFLERCFWSELSYDPTELAHLLAAKYFFLMQYMEFTQQFPKCQLGIRNPGYVNVVLSKQVISRLFLP